MLIDDCPTIQCFVRKEFLYDEKEGHGEFVKAVIFGVRAEPARVPMFQVMLESGAQWARVPINKICLQPCEQLPIEQLVWWDSYGYEFAVHQFSFLKNHKVTALGRDGVIRTGNYLFTLDWMKTGWSETPDQHKNHHFIALQTGQLIAYPNNRLVWLDPSWIEPAPDKNWKTPTKAIFVEGL
jgi:hypothetical protein